jgi:phosphatidylinositol-3-phosphatase
MRRVALLAALVAVTGLLGLQPRGLAADSSVNRLDHVFVITEENESLQTIYGDTTDAPNINDYITKYGFAADYYGIGHPSEENYVAQIGGNYYGIQDDDDFTCPNASLNPTYSVGCSEASAESAGENYPNHTIFADNLAQQLDDAGLTWKGYFQTMPSKGFMGDCYPNTSSDCFYAAKHNGFVNYDSVQDSQGERDKMVPLDDTTLGLQADLKNDAVPNFSYIIPHQCHDMHAKAGCTNGCTSSETANAVCIQQGDTYLKGLVDEIKDSNTWKHGHDVIVITWDESDPPPSAASYLDQGCCDAGSAAGGGGGPIPTIVITNGPAHHVEDTTPYNHYSLLKTVEDGFGLRCVQNTCDSDSIVPPMAALFNNS